MKKLMLALVAVSFLVGNAFANEAVTLKDFILNINSLSLSEIEKVLPNLNNGFAYSFADSKMNYIATMDVVRWKDFTFEAGYAGRAKNTADKLVGVVSYRIGSLKDLNIDVPILKYIDLSVGLYGGYGRIEKVLSDPQGEFDFGSYVRVLSLDF